MNQKVLLDDYRRLALHLAGQLPSSPLYVLHHSTVLATVRLFHRDSITRRIHQWLGSRLKSRPDHDRRHARRVALHTALLLTIETGARPSDDNPLLQLGLYGGLLHDLYRGQAGHEILAGRTAGRLLRCLGVEGLSSRWVESAIRNHVAFHDGHPIPEPAAQLLSDALYDADKLEWGPENFTRTIWRMMASRDTSIAQLPRIFTSGMAFIQQVKGTFRTRTGRTYGPPIIDRGLWIGSRILERLPDAADGSVEGHR